MHTLSGSIRNGRFLNDGVARNMVAFLLSAALAGDAAVLEAQAPVQW